MLSAEGTLWLSRAILVAAACLPLVMFVWGWKRTYYTFVQFLYYIPNRLITQWLWNLRITGRIELPPGQGAVVISNHLAGVDPAYVIVATRRMMHWMVAREYVEAPPLRAFFRHMEVIPVNRGGVDTKSTKAAIRLASEGRLVGMFPEGRINMTNQLLLPGRAGAAMVALKARVPVIPCYLEGVPYAGTYYSSLLMRAHVRLRVGKPIDISPYYGRDGDKEVLAALTLHFMREIARLAGQPDYEVRLAGREWRLGGD